MVPNTAPTMMVMAQQIDEKIDRDVFDDQPRARGPGTHARAMSCRVCAAGDANCGRWAARITPECATGRAMMGVSSENPNYTYPVLRVTFRWITYCL